MMIGFKNFALAIVAALMAFLAAPVKAQTMPDIVGDWYGNAAIASGDQMMVLIVTRGADGKLQGEFENRDVLPGRRAPVTEIIAADGRLTFKIDPLRLTYEATWDEATRQWRGKISRGDTRLDFLRGLPPQKPRIEGLEGRWEAALRANGVRLRQVLRMSSNNKAAFLVGLAGPAIDVIALMRSQRRNMSIGEGSSEERERRLEPLFVSFFQALAASKTPEEGRTAVLALLTPEAKTALGVPPETDSALILRDLVRARVWYLAHYDPLPNIEHIKVPVLAINGSLDR